MLDFPRNRVSSPVHVFSKQLFKAGELTKPFSGFLRQHLKDWKRSNQHQVFKRIWENRIGSETPGFWNDFWVLSPHEPSSAIVSNSQPFAGHY